MLIIRKVKSAYEIVYIKENEIVDTFPNLDESILKLSNEAILALAKIYMKNIPDDLLTVHRET